MAQRQFLFCFSKKKKKTRKRFFLLFFFTAEKPFLAQRSLLKIYNCVGVVTLIHIRSSTALHKTTQGGGMGIFFIFIIFERKKFLSYVSMGWWSVGDLGVRQIGNRNTKKVRMIHPPQQDDEVRLEFFFFNFTLIPLDIHFLSLSLFPL